jgi:hypothetical protein
MEVMEMKRVFLPAFLAASLALAAGYNGNIGVLTTSPSDGTVLDVFGGPVQFSFNFSASVAGWNADPAGPKASLEGFRDLVASSNSSRLFIPSYAYSSGSLTLIVTSNVPYQVVLGVPTVSGNALPLSRYLIGVGADPSTSTGPGVYTLDSLTAPTVVYTGTGGGTEQIRIYARVLVYKNDLLPGTQTITIPVTVVPTP